MVEFSLPGVVPSKKNNRRLFYSNGVQRNLPSQKFTDWHDDAVDDLALQCRGLEMPLSARPVYIAYVFRMRDEKRRDISNMIQGIEDLLVENEVLKDDAWKYLQIAGAYAVLDPKNVGVKFAIDDETESLKKWVDNQISYS